MNKQGWEVKKLGEICEIVSGSTPKTKIPEYWNGDYNWVTPAELNEDNDVVYQTNRKITLKAIRETNLKLLPIGTILLSSRAPIGKVAITGIEMYSNQGFKNLICSDAILNRFLFRFLKGKTPYLNSLGRGATFKEISKEIVQNIPIPVPPISIQNQIVKELDTLQAIITKKKAQLVELDNLAQATFYEMFGDPVENEKGWNIKYWKDIFITCTGKLNANAMKDNGQYPFFTCSKQIFYIDVFAFDCEALILAGNNATANYDVKYYNGKFNAYQRTYILNLINKNFSYIYFRFLLESKLDLMQSQSLGISTKYLTMSILNSLNFITPPCTLQNQFAKRIEAIEKQKALINQSISETQLLFDSAMDNYFN